MPTTKSLLTIPIGRINFTVSVEWSFLEGEPMVMYYPDGSGYPGSPPEFDYADRVECLECEYPVDGPGYYEDTDTGQSWEYAERSDRPGAFAIADRWIRDAINGGAFIDDLFDHAEDDDYA